MPRNGSGTYSLPPIYLATPGTTIQAQQHNDPLTDIASAMTASVAADGQTPMTGVLNANGNKITGLATATNPSDAVRFDQISDPSAVALATLQTYGWAVTGNAPTIANIDATNIASGQYRFVTGATGTFPTGVIAADTGQIIMIRETVNEGSMIMAVGAGRVFWRALVAGVWGAWQEHILVAASAGNGLLVKTGTGTSALRQVTSPDGSVNITNPAGVAGDIQLSTGTIVGINTTTGAATVGPWALPAGVKRFTVTSNKSSLSGTNGFLIQLRVAGSFVTSGYSSRSLIGTSNNQSSTAGLLVAGTAAANYWDGAMDFWLHDPATNLWLARHTGSVIDTATDMVSGSGSIALAGAVDGVRITTTGGNTFDVSSFNVFY